MKSVTRQHGIVLLLVVLIMLAIGGVAILGTISGGAGSALRSQQKLTSNADILAAARAALIGYAVNGTAGLGNRPGQLPNPDTLQNTNYDGLSDTTSCLNGAVANGLPALSGVPAQVATLHCLGRLPWKQLGLAIDGASGPDVLGIVPWYAVSQNLADPNPAAPCMGILNPSTASASTTTFSCAATTGPAWPWLKVCDASGRLLSDRVAFVLIVPGELLQTTGRNQARVVTATGTNPQGYGQPGDFLDAIPLPSGWASLPVAQRCTGYDNAALTGEFVSAAASASFNDQLIYVTVDELMLDLEKLVANEIREELAGFRTAYGGYPWLAPVMDPTLTDPSFVGQLATSSGLIPFHDRSSSTSSRFLTELSWNIGGTDTAVTGNIASTYIGNTHSNFNCGGGVNPTCNCRIRTATTATTIPVTLTSPELATFKVGAVSTPSVSCKRDAGTTRAARDNSLTCDLHTITVSTTPVTYSVQRRNNSGGNCVTGGTRLNIGDFTGTTTRTITLNISAFSGVVSALPGSATTHTRRSISNPGANTLMLIEVSDTWVPTSLGTIPFDQIIPANYPRTGYGRTNQASEAATFSNIRLHADVPSWYITQKWYESIYAAFSPDVTPTTNAANCTTNCFTVGSKANVNAVVISAGPQLVGQNRFVVTPAISDFLEAPNSTGPATRTFASTTQPRNTTYADTLVTIPK